MLSDEEKKALLAAARSEVLRYDFDILRRNSAARSPKDVDELIAFLTFANAFGKSIVRRHPIDVGLCRL